MFSEFKSTIVKPTRKYTYREIDEYEVLKSLEDIFTIYPQVHIFYIYIYILIILNLKYFI